MTKDEIIEMLKDIPHDKLIEATIMMMLDHMIKLEERLDQTEQHLDALARFVMKVTKNTEEYHARNQSKNN